MDPEEIEDEEVTFFRPEDVLIEVLGGVCSITRCPPNITVHIVDYDNNPDACVYFDDREDKAQSSGYIEWGESAI